MKNKVSKKVTDAIAVANIAQLSEQLREVNTLEFNILKVVEELHEVGDVLIKQVTKNQNKPDLATVASEIGDLFIRLQPVMQELGLHEPVKEHIHKKCKILTKGIKNGTIGTAVLVVHSDGPAETTMF